MKNLIQVGPDKRLTVELVAKVASDPKIKVFLSRQARLRVKKSREVVERMLRKGKIVYGVTTGFGNFKNKFIDPESVRELQQNLIRSHSVGVGELLPQDIVRAALVARLSSLAQGYSGVRLELLELLCNLINRNIIPAVPSQGSVGASGDLAPLSHMGLVLMGEGSAWYKGKLLTGGEALRRAGLKPLFFEAKEGLAWNNGTAVMTGIGVLAVAKTSRLIDIADLACALTLEAVCGVDGAFDARVHTLRPHPGQQLSAKNIKRFISGSKLVNSIPNRIQDSYSLRCAPQVHGAARDIITYAAEAVDRELNSVTDNPLIFVNPDRAISAGNFHGEPIALALDALGIGLAELASISERRTAKLIDPATSEGLPAFLVKPEKAGLHNGLMIAQYTAAALVSENKVLAHPASVDSIPTSANQEDHVSMGTIAARKAWEIVENVENVLAIEFLTAVQAISFRNPRLLGRTTKEAYQLIRKSVPPITSDRVLSQDIERIRDFMNSERFLQLLKN